jgi:ribosomal-protein-alanine N-acetyltransferase
MAGHVTTAPVVRLERPSGRRANEFLQAVKASRALHGRWVAVPSTPEQYRLFLRRLQRSAHVGHFVCTPDGSLAGVININEIVLGAFCSAYLGYYALAPHHGRGFMRAGLRAVVARAFGEYGLHRLEANIQPGNDRSVALVSGLGFRREGFSPKYLKIAGRWRDHERWAITSDAWRAAAVARR